MESSKGETAAANVRISSLDAQLQQARAALASRDSEIQQQKVRIIVFALMCVCQHIVG